MKELGIFSFIVDTGYPLVNCDAGFVCHLSASEPLTGMNLLSLFQADDRQMIEATLHEALERKRTYVSWICRPAHADGAVVHISGALDLAQQPPVFSGMLSAQPLAGQENHDMSAELINQLLRLLERQQSHAALLEQSLAESRRTSYLNDSIELAAGGTRRPLILVVDDAAVNRMILNKILINDYDIIQAADGEEALQRLKERSAEISAIMLDLVMPIKDGFAFLEEKNQMEGMDTIPVIVVTSTNDASSEVKALQSGAWDYVTKPYNPDIILFRLKNVILRSQLNAFNQLKYLAEYDQLTNVYNKSKFYADTRQLLLDHNDVEFAFVRLDINRFSLINSYFGVERGDALLRHMAVCLSAMAAHNLNFTYGRIESDIFCFCLPYAGKGQLNATMRELRTAIREFEINFDLRPNFGVYIIDDPSLPIDLMYDRANLASKNGKGDYNSLYTLYCDDMRLSVLKEQQILNEMETALDEEQFHVFLQPKYDLKTNKLAGAEALVRWRPENRPIITPDEFIPLFERNGFISKLDYYVWERVCLQLRFWLDAGLNPLPVSVNVSRVDLYNPQITRVICRLVDRFNLPRNLLQLELTESAFIDDLEELQRAMHSFKDEGFVVMMDDFGSGYSSLSTLKNIDVDVLKIDMCFFGASAQPKKGENIISSVLHMARLLNINTVAEGVETAAHADFLRRNGCDFGQGYLFAKPMPIDDYERLWLNGEPFRS